MEAWTANLAFGMCSHLCGREAHKASYCQAYVPWLLIAVLRFGTFLGIQDRLYYVQYLPASSRWVNAVVKL